MKNEHILSILLALIFSSTALSQGLSANDQQALQKTMHVLQNKEKRNEAVNSSDKGKQADAYAEKVGGQHKDDIYQLASKVFEKMTIKYGGDSEKMKEVLERAQRDPSGFANSEFTAEELKALQVLGQKLNPVAPGAK